MSGHPCQVRLVTPSRGHLAGFVAAVRRRGARNTIRGAEAAREASVQIEGYADAIAINPAETA